MNIQPWWEAYKGRLEFELAALDKAGILYELDNEAFAKSVVRLKLRVPIGGHTYQMIALFPDLYPYFRFEVEAPELDLPHHQNPFGKNLCLLGRSSDLWHTNDTLASFLTDRLPTVMKAGTSSDASEVADLEQHQAEPYADYYSYQPGTAVVVGNNLTIDKLVNSGSLLLGLMAPASQLLQAAVLEVRDEDGKVLVQTEDRLRRAYSQGSLVARWSRLIQPPLSNKPIDVFNQLYQIDPHPNKAESYRVEDGRLQVRAALFPEELRGWREVDHGWLFTCRLEPMESWSRWDKNRKRRDRAKRRNKGR